MYKRIQIFASFALLVGFLFMACAKEKVSCTEATWYKDADNDGLGDPSMSILDCEQPAGYVSNFSDSDDTKPEGYDATVDASILSQNIGENYPLRIFIPKEYEDNKKLPVVYLLDGLTVYMGRTFYEDLVSYAKSIGLKAILVAIGDKTGADRTRDFAPAGCGGGDGKHFDNFYKFLTEEVIPFIDGKYENDHAARTLIGFSSAGNFTNFTLFRENPDNIIFHGFISIDAPGCSTSLYEEQLNQMALPENANLKIHLSLAENTEVEQLYDLLAAKDFLFLKIDFKKYPQETHDSVVSPSIKRGLQFIYIL
ncbi:MAG: alpha/beta hydrolase-fold protein [Saprospiraceae bacterium]